MHGSACKPRRANPHAGGSENGNRIPSGAKIRQIPAGTHGGMEVDMLELLLAALLGQLPAAPPVSPALDYDYYKARVQPLFLEKREGHARCVTCHAGSTTLRLQRLSEGATGWSEEQSRQNFDAVT